MLSAVGAGLAVVEARVQFAMSSGALACRPLTWWCSEVPRCRLWRTTAHSFAVRLRGS